jgi:hypothetical protein
LILISAKRVESVVDLSLFFQSARTDRKPIATCIVREFERDGARISLGLQHDPVRLKGCVFDGLEDVLMLEEGVIGRNLLEACSLT